MPPGYQQDEPFWTPWTLYQPITGLEDQSTELPPATYPGFAVRIEFQAGNVGVVSRHVDSCLDVQMIAPTTEQWRTFFVLLKCPS